MTSLAQRLSPPEVAAYPGSHLGLKWRPLIASDGPALAELTREVEAFEDSFHRLSAADIADLMEGANGVDLVDTIVGLDSEGNIGAVASVRILRQLSDQAVAQLKALVHPHWRGRGLGRALLFWQEARARQLLVAEFGSECELPAQIMNIVDAHMTDRRRLYIAAGFYAKRTFSIMYREIDGSESYPVLKNGYILVPWSQINIDEARRVHMDVFVDHFWPQMRGRWWEEAMSNVDYRWSSAVVAPDGSLAGYCVVGRPAERWAATGKAEAYIELIGVSAQHRGQGLVRALLGHAIVAAGESGITRIGLDVDMLSSSQAHDIYEHYGFIDYRSEVYYTIDY